MFKMKILGLTILAILVSMPSISCLTKVIDLSKNFVEKPKAYFIPHTRAKRTTEFQADGRGTFDEGYMRERLAGTIYEDENNRIDASEFVQFNWNKGFHPVTTVGIGGVYTRNIFRTKHSSLDLQLGYDKTFSQGYSQGAYDAMLHYRITW